MDTHRPDCLSFVAMTLAAVAAAARLLVARLQPDERLTRVHRIAVLNQPFDDRGREVCDDGVRAAAHLDLAKYSACSEHRAAADRKPCSAIGVRQGTERAGLLGDEQPPLGSVTVGMAAGVLKEQRPRRV